MVGWRLSTGYRGQRSWICLHSIWQREASTVIESDEAAGLLEPEVAPDERSASLRKDAAALRAEIVGLMSAPEGLLFDLASLRADLEAAKERASMPYAHDRPGGDSGAAEDLGVAEDAVTPRRGFFGLRKRR
jgi:hypothetical protein